MDTDNNTTLAHSATLPADRPAGSSGIHLLDRGIDAFVARLVLADAAERCIDLQYYIWHADTTGLLLTERLIAAADRGVRVRMLIDDWGTAIKDANLLALDAHSNIEVRLFNPVPLRWSRRLGALLNFGRANRRMHNKLYVADEQVIIVGGRNIGDEYFGAHPDLEFGDLDVLAVGPVLKDACASFDRYWNCPLAVPVRTLAEQEPDSRALLERRTQLRAHAESPKAAPYMEALRESKLEQQLRTGTARFMWGKAWLVYDDPEKIMRDPTDPSGRLGEHLRGLVEATRTEMLISSAYFIPGRAGVRWLNALRRRGVRVRVLTNSLASTDVAAVHAGYVHYRKPLLRVGVELYETKPVSGRARRKRWGERMRGSSRASLHAKSFVYDRQAVFIGSMNLDPRSVELNTEVGVVVVCEALAQHVAQEFEGMMREDAWRLRLVRFRDPGGRLGRRLQWLAYEKGLEVAYPPEPGASIWRRLGVWLLSKLPIEGQL